jgi:hypothetical protein
MLGSSHTSFIKSLLGARAGNLYVLFICKTKSRLRRRHCGQARHFKTDPTKTVALCFGYAKTLFWQRRHCGLARHFKTDPTKSVALCLGYVKTLFWQADGTADEQDNRVYRAGHWSCVVYSVVTYKKIWYNAYTCIRPSLNKSKQVQTSLNKSKQV